HGARGRGLRRQPGVAVPRVAHARVPGAGRGDGGADRRRGGHRRAVVHPAGAVGGRVRGRGRSAGPALHRAGAHRGVVRREAARLLVTGPVAGPRQPARAALTSARDGLVAAEPSGKTTVGTVRLPPLTCSTY